jgi:hypothetical protein
MNRTSTNTIFTQREIELLQTIFEEQAIYEYIDNMIPTDCPYNALWNKVFKGTIEEHAYSGITYE